ncbi:unnamed protein product [Linum tenue]|uniref:F-box/LRR-repeat protein 15/At3g58940/PEG3-like LRR domain-containing protein n=1 Tax=Linum tenue TaxID=586396 RepID=A0AAV0GR48_9ROSI|nr:unnamed protein product [Linum tenue]
METKYAICTAVLSRRWEGLWTRVSSLDFDFDGRLVYMSVAKTQKLEPASDVRKRGDLEFCRFVDKVLGQHENLYSLRRFRFHFPVHDSYLYKCRMGLSETRFRFKWESVFVPPIEEIDVMVMGETECGIPHCMHRIPLSFYTLKNLKVAKLYGVGLGAIDESVFLPSVKILQLCSVKFENFKSLGRLLSGCPVVETVHLKNWLHSNYKEKDRIEVSLPCLKNLKIFCFGYWRYPMHPIVIEAPNLEDLYLEQFADVQFEESIPLLCLHSAHVDLREESPSYVIRLLAQISNAKRMSLSGATLVIGVSFFFPFI